VSYFVLWLGWICTEKFSCKNIFFYAEKHISIDFRVNIFE
jgi:hypothetical protein